MSKPYPKKFYFTQISAPIVGFAGSFLLLGIARHFHWFTDYNFGSVFLKIIIFLIVFVGGLIGSIILWGRILVILRILSKEEAKGYPFSKPWEGYNINKPNNT